MTIQHKCSQRILTVKGSEFIMHVHKSDDHQVFMQYDEYCLKYLSISVFIIQVRKGIKAENGKFLTNCERILLNFCL